ncbi:hypothetical protein ACIBBE_24905 [Streptomyces sp. NPDC051644]
MAPLQDEDKVLVIGKLVKKGRLAELLCLGGQNLFLRRAGQG